MMAEQAGVPITVPFDHAFYEGLIAKRDDFSLVSSHEVPAGRGYGFHVSAGQAFRLVQTAAAQIIDTCFANADDPREHHHSGTQVALEGTQVTRLTRVWSNPPWNRPLCTCIADTVRPRANASNTREHAAHGAHCNPHLWTLYTDQHPRSCYDNLRAGFAQRGYSQRAIHDNQNLFQNTALDPVTSDYLLGEGNAQAGDFIEFYAEVPLLVVISICPHGTGSIPIEDWDEGEVPVYPVQVEIFNTGVEPVPWPQ